MPELAQLYEIFANMPIVSISNAQRKPLSRGGSNRGATLHAGIGSDNKTRLEGAIQIAQQFGMTLKVAAKWMPLTGTTTAR